MRVLRLWIVQSPRLANDPMDFGDRLFGLANLGRIEASCRSNLAHGGQKRRLDKLMIGLD